MIPTSEQERAVIATVTYASLFDYPLSIEQLHAGLIRVRADADSIEAWRKNSTYLQTVIDYRDGWYFPAGRSDLIATRARREVASRELLKRDERILSLLSRLPFVRMVALSGSLAHLNAEGEADLDLFVITSPRRVWGVTVATLILTKLLGLRKRLCLNYVVSERALKIAPEDLFSANQIIHLRPICGHDVFARFVKANGFVRTFYPNFELPPPRPSAFAKATAHRQGLIERLLDLGVAPVFERFARALYGWYLRRKSATWQSRDQVRLDAECLKLHTSSHRASTLDRFDAAMATVDKQELPTAVAM